MEDRCYGLNVCVPPNYRGSLATHVMVFKVGAFGSDYDWMRA